MRYDAVMKKIQHEKSALELLGGMAPEAFLRDYWQKKPLLVRQAVPGFSGVLTPEELAGLACEEDVQSRLVTQRRTKWQVEDGPFAEEHFLGLPGKNWTLLVQDVNHHLNEADALLRRFSFIPYARLDDLMVSYAPDGGGVGPHFDSYDVFLLQGQGKRLWRISEQQDLTLVQGAPLRILKNFETQQEWILEPGDMLYLPPHVAHWGIAVGDCMTYSIGFRAPSAQELVSEFLNYLQEKSSAAGMYADPDLKLQANPAEMGGDMLKKVAGMLHELQWDQQDVSRFLGQYLSSPKPYVLFDQPALMSETVFRERLHIEGISLARKSQLLYCGESLYLNGDEFLAGNIGHELRQLADNRQLPAGFSASDALVKMLHAWYLDGYLQFPDE